MKCKISVILGMLLVVLSSWGQPLTYVWTSPSENSSESMPCGGGDIGMNVWVEKGDLLFYVSRSGAFDENNTLLKQGRFRIRLSPNPFLGATDFCQELQMDKGCLVVSAGDVSVCIWADVFRPAVHVELNSKDKISWNVSYENWRYQDRPLRKGEGQQCSYKWAPPKNTVTLKDSIWMAENRLYFCHLNKDKTVFDFAVNQQGLDGVKDKLMNPLERLISGGVFWGDNLVFQGTSEGVYAGTDYKSWSYVSRSSIRKDCFHVVLAIGQGTLDSWRNQLLQTCNSIHLEKDKKVSQSWWKEFWDRSFIDAEGEAAQLTRNYTLFRYMLGCNAYGSYPTKFNGGLFTFDPCFVDANQSFTPDYRKWGGGTMTAQNQRLVYWPMLKSGDVDMMKAQFDTYLRMLPNAELRSMVYWQHGGACFAEQIENYGLPNPAEYGYKRPSDYDKGVEYNAWLEYEWDTVLEFCQMILDARDYEGLDIYPYIPLIEGTVRFFDEHYRYLARMRGQKDLTADGKLVLFPGSACETYKMTYNSASTIAALKKVLASYGKMKELEARIPDIPMRIIDGKMMISPAVVWERINNIETPQLYPVFPWRLYGLEKENLEVARNTYLYDPDAVRFRSHVGWKQDNIWAACLGLTDDAARLTSLKLSDGPYRFPAFWGPGYDWSPDHNWGGSGMIGLQEMLLQEVDEKILLFPAWPKDWNVHFKLHAKGNTVIEADLKDGVVNIICVTPQEREKDLEIMIK